MANASQYAVVVKRTTRLTPNMQRLCLTGESLQSFPNTLPGAYIKLLFDTHGNPLTSELNDQEVAMRTYTVSAFDIVLEDTPNSSAIATRDFFMAIAIKISNSRLVSLVLRSILVSSN